jgi:putative transposase
MGQSERHANTSVSLINYHVVWTPRRRRRVLVGPIADRLQALLVEQAAVVDCRVIALQVMPDHVHLFINAPPTLAADQIMFRLKSYTARVLRQEFPDLLKLPSMWTRSYYVSTADNVSSETVRRYIESQTRR